MVNALNYIKLFAEMKSGSCDVGIIDITRADTADVGKLAFQIEIFDNCTEKRKKFVKFDSNILKIVVYKRKWKLIQNLQKKY